MTTKPSANERRLAKLLGEAFESERFSDRLLRAFAAYLARRGVLAVCAETVPNRKLFTMRPGQNPEQWPRDADAERVWGKRERAHLRRLAKGAK